MSDIRRPNPIKAYVCFGEVIVRLHLDCPWTSAAFLILLLLILLILSLILILVLLVLILLALILWSGGTCTSFGGRIVGKLSVPVRTRSRTLAHGFADFLEVLSLCFHRQELLVLGCRKSCRSDGLLVGRSRCSCFVGLVKRSRWLSIDLWVWLV